jgi:molecular chaperone GrpE
LKKANKPIKNTSQPKQPANEDLFTKLEVEEMISDLTGDLQRIQAEFINYKRRAEEEKLKAINFGKEQAATALLPVLDNIERAIAHEPEDIKEHAWVKGISSVANLLESQLRAIGLVKIGNPGDIFDPNIHDAVSMDDGNGDTEVVAEVLQTGYCFGDTIIRPAMVKVTKK